MHTVGHLGSMKHAAVGGDVGQAVFNTRPRLPVMQKKSTALTVNMVQAQLLLLGICASRNGPWETCLQPGLGAVV